tara:strand:- start:109 stop:1239 length:1131 start_codon:yes stop_codon:yes gene_type:complete
MAKRKPAEHKPGDTVQVLGSPESTKITPKVPESLTVLTTKKKASSFKDIFSKVGKISVKPYLDPKLTNMGLENYGYALFPGTHHEEQLAAIERNGVVRYITGLDEFAPEVQNLNDESLRDSIIHNIRSVVAHLEKTLATNVIKIDDEEFWNKVKLLRPDNHVFWGKISMRVSNEVKYLEPNKDAYDLVKYMAIEAGGFDIIAKSFEDAQASPVAPKFYLDKEVHTVNVRTSFKKLRNKAIGLLDKVYHSNPKKLMYLTKALDSNSISYKNSTPLDVLYDTVDEYINGNGAETNKERASNTFIDLCDMDMETLKLKAVIKDASFYKIIALKADGMLYHSKTSTVLGRNVTDVVQMLKNPLNEDVLTSVLKDVESFWV